MKAKSMTINLIASLFAFAVQFFISFWLSPYVVGKLGEEAYGFLNLANNFVAYASLLAVAVNSMASRFISMEYNQKHIEKAKKYFSSVFWANCYLFLFIFLVSIVLIYQLEKIITISPELVFQVKLTFLLSLINMGFSFIGTVYTAAAFSTNKMHYNSIIQIVSNITKSGLILVLFIFLPPKIYFLSFAVLISGIITFVCNFCISRKLFGEFTVSRRYRQFDMLIMLIKSGGWMLLSNISNLLLNGLDLLISNQFLNGSMMGRLAIAKQIPAAFSNLLGYFASIFNSSLTLTYAKGDGESVKDEIITLQKILTVFLTVPFAGMFVYGIDFLKLWLKSSNYTEDELIQIYVLMMIILVDIIVSTYMYSIHSVFIALNKIRFYSTTLFIASILSVVVTVILVVNTNMGIYAIAGTSTVILGITHGIIVPIYAAKLLEQKKLVFIKSEINSWLWLFTLLLFFYITRNLFTITGWSTFFVTVIISGVCGYILEFFVVLKKNEKMIIINKFKALKNKLVRN